MKSEQLYVKIGVRNKGSLMNPVILKKSDFIFPEETIWIWSTDTEIPAVPSTDSGLLSKSKKPVHTIAPGYMFPVGKQRLIHKDTEIFNEVRKLTTMKTYRAYNDIKLLSRNVLIVVNCTNLNYMYRYNPYNGHTFDRVYNRIRTTYEYCRDRMVGKARWRYLTIKIPEMDTESLTLLERSLDYKPQGIVNLFPDESMFQVIDLWRMMSPEHREDSAMNTLTPDEMAKTIILFEHNLGVTMYNLADLIGTVKDYDMDSFASYPAKTARSVLFMYMLHVKNTSPKAIMEIDGNQTTVTSTSADGVDRISIGKNTPESTADIEELEDNVTKHIETALGESIRGPGTIVEDDTVKQTALLQTREEFMEEQYTPDGQIDRALMEGRISDNDSRTLKNILSDQDSEGITASYQIDREEFKIKPEEIVLPDIPSVIDKSMLKDTISALDDKYIRTMYDKDIKAVIYGIQKAGVMISNYDVVKTEDIAGAWEEHHISFTPIGGRKTTRVVRLPQIDKDGVIAINGNKYKMIRQRADLPIRKINSNTVTLSSYVGKILIEKIRYNKDNKSAYILKRLMEVLEDTSHPVTTVVNIGTTVVDGNVPIEYSYYGRVISTMICSGIEFNFNHRTRVAVIKDRSLLSWYETDGTIIGHKGKLVYIMDMDGIVHTTPFVITAPKSAPKLTRVGKMDEILKIDISSAPKEFATIRVLKVSIPVGLVLAYYAGLDNILSMFKVDYVKYEGNKRVAEPVGINDVVARFADGRIHMKNLTPENQMIFNGFDKLSKVSKDISMGTLNSRDNTIFVMMDLLSRHIGEIETNETLFLDPITISVLIEIGEPTTLRGLLVRACEMLVDDNYEHPNSLHSMHIKSHERIPGLLYKTLANAVKVQKGASGYGKAGVDVNRFETWGTIANDSTLMIMEDLNPIANLKQQHDITYTGIGGRSIDTMVSHTREFHKSDIGVISEASKDSGKVGVTMYATSDPTIESVRGLVKDIPYMEKSVTNKLSISASVSAFALHEDPKRLNFIDVQNQHTKSMDSYIVLPNRTGYEAVIPMRMTEDFAVVSREHGEVISVSKRSIRVKYKETGAANYPIKEWFTKEESGNCYRHNVKTDLKKGDKFTPGMAITYDEMFFGRDMLNPGGIALKNGMIMRTLYVESYSTYEDSYEVTQDGLPMLNSSMVKVKSGRITTEDDVITLIKVGEDVASDTVIMQSGKSVGGGKYDKESVDLLSSIKGSSVKAGISGTVKQVRFYYNADLADMSPSLRKVIKEADLELAEYLGKPGMTGRVDKTFSDSGVPIGENEIIFKIYLYTSIPNSIGDKVVIGNQLKATLGEVGNKKVTFDGEPVHIYFSTTSQEARIVASPDLIGTMVTLLKLYTKEAIKIFNKEK